MGAVNPAKHAVALPAPDNSGMWWFHESLVKPADIPISPLDFAEQEYKPGETVVLTSDAEAMKEQFAKDSFKWDDSILPMLGKTFKVMQVNKKAHAVGLKS